VIHVAERNAVILRECRKCEKKFRCTALEIRDRGDHCNPGGIVYPDCGFEEKVQSFLEVNP
jgi:hypothetical protein